MFTLFVLGLFAFLAGFIDAIVGGGGLILIPALLIVYPELPTADALGSNKAAAFSGVFIATLQYARRMDIPWKVMTPAAVIAFISSLLGAYAVTLMSNLDLRPFIILALLLVAVYTFVKKDLGKVHAPKRSPNAQRWMGMAAGALLGFYDGFLGPGTGSFLMFIFIALLGFSFLSATASAKVVNLASNLAALLLFAVKGHVVYWLVLPLAMCNMLGSFLGSRLAMLRGSGFVRLLFLLVVLAVMVRLAYDTFVKY